MGQGTDGMGEAVLRSEAGRAGKVEQRSRSNDEIIVIKADFLACADFLAQHILVACIRMDLFCRGVDEFDILLVIDGFEFEDGLFGFHVSHADPHPRGDVAEHIAVADDGDIVFPAEFASQIQRGSVPGKPCSDDNNFSHGTLLSL